MASQDASARTEERIGALLRGTAYRVFGFGTEAVDFARRLEKLEEKAPAVRRLISDVANRVAFIDFLRFEIGWRAEETNNVGDSLRLGANLDAVETYLLCTCIDALAGGREEVSFADWVSANPEQVEDAFGDRDSITSSQYAEVTEILFSAYRSTGISLTREFLGFFTNLPPFVQSAITGSLVLIEGDYLSKAGQERLKKWQQLPEEKKLQSIALDYLYGIRRSKYTHAGKIQEAALPGHWRRAVERGALPSDWFQGWQQTYLRHTANPDKIKYTLFTRGSRDENFLLRAAIAVHVLTLMEYAVDERYWEGFFAHYRSISAIYAFLHEMESNRECIDYLASVQAITSDNDYRYYGLPGLSTSRGEMLLRDSRDAVSMLAGNISSYLHWARELNGKIEEFNSVFSQAKDSTWLDQQKAVADFSQKLSSSNEARQLYDCHRWIYPNLKRHVESGQVHYGSSDVSGVH